jgi:hypothetical protein
MAAITTRRLVSWLALLALLVVTFHARIHNRADVFHGDGRIYFIEGDCYSRMTRAQMVDQGQWIIRHHEFENWPEGTMPHTTAPFDWMIVGLKKVVSAALWIFDGKSRSILRGQELDVAGALISPLLGVITAAWLWWWAGRLWLPCRWLMVLFFALSPILVHGTVLGRPDHQSLLILLISIAVGAEFALADLGLPARLARRWAIAAGISWGLALWVSLYEPLIFFAGGIGRHVLFHRAALFSRVVRGRWIALGAIMIFAIVVDGWRITLPDAALRERFAAWSTTIGELRHLNIAKATIWHWTGLFWVSSFVLLWFAARRDKRAFSVLLLVTVMLGLTIWQLRWGYFLALAVALSIPWQLGALGRLGWGVGAAALIPMAFAWSNTLHPGEAVRERRKWQAAVQDEWRRVAEFMRGPEKRPFLAPWWASPQVAYWSGQPGIAGTSHQSLSGIVDSARFYLAEKPAEAAAILRARGVRYVIIDDLSYTSEGPSDLLILSNSRKILGLKNRPEEPFGKLLAEHPRLAPPFLRYISPKERGLVVEVPQFDPKATNEKEAQVFLPQYHQVYAVEPDKL